MSRMSDMAQTIEELRSAAAAISDVADWLTNMFSGEPQAEDAPASPPEPELTLEQVRTVLADKSRQGHTAEIRGLLEWAQNDLVYKAKLAYEGGGDFHCGEWCRFCKAKAARETALQQSMALPPLTASKMVLAFFVRQARYSFTQPLPK